MALRLFVTFALASLSLAEKGQREPWVKIQGVGLLKQWASSVIAGPPADWKSDVTPQLLVMANAASFLKLPTRIQDNIDGILSRSAGVQLRWMGDRDCRSYLQAHYDKELASFYMSKEHASNRGNLCRTAVLLREGGFYADLDMELTTPLGDLVNSKTTFMSVYSERSHTALNTLLAARPGSPVLEAALSEMRKWYRHPELRHSMPADKTADERMGPLTLLRGIRHAVRESCPGSVVDAQMSSEFKCGEEVFQFHRERTLDCKGNAEACRAGRATSSLEDHRIGLFEVGSKQSSLIGWPRAAFCVDNSCAEETAIAAVGDYIHVGYSALPALIIGTATLLLVMPSMVLGFQDFFLDAHEIVKGPRVPRFTKGMN